MTYLQQNPPRRAQYRAARRRTPTGLFVVHTAENTPDYTPPDTGGENVAGFISRRGDAGSYHILADSDSWIHVVPFESEAYGDGTGSNPYAIHVSVATRAALWPTKPTWWREGAIRQLALGTRSAMHWLKTEHGIDTPLRRVNKAQSTAGWGGFIGHGERDPGRRSDPGLGFPWVDYFAAIDDPNHDIKLADRVHPQEDNVPSDVNVGDYSFAARLAQACLNAHGAFPGHPLDEDGDFRTKSSDATKVKQKQWDIPVTGNVDGLTWRYLLNA